MNGLPKKKTDHWTYDDLLTLPEGERWEIIDGEIFDMTPSPTSRHQMVSGNLFLALAGFLEGKPCRAFHAPMDLKFSESDVVQPDLFVVCRETQIRPGFVEGPPALLIEILSPSTMFHDRIRKLGLYARRGVPEVWLVTPFPSSVEVFVLDAGSYRLIAACAKTDMLHSPAFPGLAIPLARVFDFPVSREEENSVVREARLAYAEATMANA